jgi:hypothetical protein
MDTGNILQGIGLFVCIGAIILVALIAFAMRSLAGRRAQDNSSTMWNKRGTEQPRYDDPDVESSGGFGSVPATGRRSDIADVLDVEDDDISNRPLHRDVDPDLPRGGTSGSRSGFGGDQPRRRDRDDDDVRSSGGFGGG